MNAGHKWNCKDQSGVLASSEWLRERGRATYSARQRGPAQTERTTRPITWERFETVTDTSMCPADAGVISPKTNPSGGTFYHCNTCPYYLGWRASEGTGEERIV